MRRIGLVGCGFIGTVHSYALDALHRASLVDARVTRVLDSDADRARSAAALHGAEVADDLAELVAAVDVVWVCTPTGAHLPVVEEAAGADRAIFCEKPLGRDLAEAERVAICLSAVPHQVGLVLRHAPVFQALRAALEDSSSGRVMGVVFRDDQYFPVGGIYRSAWRADRMQAGSGTLLEHSIHDLDLLRWLFGDPHTITAHMASFAGHEGVEDLATVHLVFPGGASATLTSVWHEITTRPSTRRLEVFCERRLLWLDDDNTGPLHVETADGVAEIPCPEPDWVTAFGLPEELSKPLGLYAAQAKAFLDRLDGGAGEGTDATAALAAHRLVDAAHRSATQGGTPVSS